MVNLSLWILLMPLLGFVILGMTGKVLSRRAILTIALGACGLAFFFAAISFFSVATAIPETARSSDQIFYNWVASGNFQLSFGLLLDPLSAIMLMVITGVGLIIHIYSAGYMKHDPSFGRFFAFLNFFIFAMTLLVSADNFLFLLVGWGLVGLASFLLIGFWYQRPAAVAAAQKALVINVIGDFGLLLAIFAIFGHYGALNYLPNDSGIGVFNQVSIGGATTNVICLLLFIACAAKSAQLPLYMWLPDAMEGPTPVSALIHAATMVTAGVYLVARAHPLFEHAPTALNIVAITGGATAVFAATIAVCQLDIKRVLAYSTISQLGYMFMGEGVHNYTAGIFHLTTHAYFKALLFLGAGSVIHALDGEQDIREMGGLRRRLPITFWTFVIAALAISGMPPFAGFWSKDEILNSLLAQATTTGNRMSYVLWGVGIITAGLTAFYMFRLVFTVFAGHYRGTGDTHQVYEDGADEEYSHAPHTSSHSSHRRDARGYLISIQESPGIMTVPLILLAVLSVLGGLVGSFTLFGASGWHPFATFLGSVFTDVHTPDASLGLQWLSTGCSVGLALLGILGAWRLYGRGFSYKENKNTLYQLVLHKYYVDEFFTLVLIRPLLGIGRIASYWLEGGMLDGGSRGIAWLLRGTSSILRRLQTGYMRMYALVILIGVVLIVAYYAFRG